MNYLKEKLVYGGEFDAAELRDPPSGIGPIYIWAWNAPITREAVIRQLDEMAEGGVRTMYVLPLPSEFRPETMVTELQPPYLSPEFMEMMRFTLEQAKQRGITMWLYDEGGWPSGGAAGRVVAQLPEGRKKMMDRRKIAGAEAAKLAEGSFVRVTDAMGNTLTREQMAREETVWVYSVKDLYFQVAPADSADAEAMRLFVELTHEKYAATCGEYFSDQAQLMFTDEPETAMPAWPRGFAEKFLERFGYDIRDHLACLFEADSKDPARLDYVTLLEDILRDVFVDYQRNWCAEHGLLYGGHLDVDHTFRESTGARCCDQLYLLRGMDVPGVDAIWRQIFPYPQGYNACDTYSRYLFAAKVPADLGEPDGTMIPFYPRLATSAAAQNGNNLALVEAFGVYGGGLTMAQMRYVVGYLAARGMNLFNFFGIPFGREGHHAFGELPYMIPEMPAWKSLPAFNSWVRRLSYMAVLGERRADTALIYPVAEAALDGNARLQALKAYIDAGVGLEKEGIDFDIINVRGILEGDVKDGCLCLGKGCYSRIVVPEGIRLPEAVWQRLKQLKGESRPVLASSGGFDDLRVQLRQCRNGERIVIAFNEGRAAVDTVLSIDRAQRVYRVEPESGALFGGGKSTTAEKTEIPLHLEAGQVQVLLLSEREYPVGSQPGQLLEETGWRLEDFTQAVVRSLRIDHTGIRQQTPERVFGPVGSGDWNLDFGADFSGEVAYRTTWHRETAGSGIAVLQAEGIRYSARVQVNGVEVGHLLDVPYCCRFDAALLKEGENELVITVANTLANQYLLSGAEEFWQAKELTPYHPMEQHMHQDSIPSGFAGPVQLRVYAEMM